MRTLVIVTGHVIYNPAYTYKFQLKTTDIKLYKYNYFSSQANLQGNDCQSEFFLANVWHWFMATCNNTKHQFHF